MKHVQFLGLLALTVATACNTTPVQNTTIPNRVLGAVELSLDSAGVSSLRFNRVSTLREADAVFGTGTTEVITTTVDPYTYLVATFPVSHAVSSTTAFSNLTLYAEAKAGNVGSTAIQAITDFGGVTNPSEQTRLAKLITPIPAVRYGLGRINIYGLKAGFQAFTAIETTNAKNLAVTGGAMTNSDTLLNYGFSARCTTNGCTPNSRLIAIGESGEVSIALRVPKSVSAYKFVMDFVVMDESVSRVTRSVLPSDNAGAAEVRGLAVTASELMQFGLHRQATTLSSVTADDVKTSSLNASIFALGIGRIAAGSNGHSCGLDATGKAYCWGNNDSGQLGNGTTGGQSNVPVAVSNAASGAVQFSNITVGDIFTCGLSVDGTAYCWGSNFEGRLGDNSLNDSNIPVLVSNPVSGQKYATISASSTHACMTSVSSNLAYCWGGNSLGQLGVPNTTLTSNVPLAVSGAQSFVSISAGSEFTCGVAPNFSAYCWGNNDSGQLGNNDPTHTDSSTPVLVNGSSVDAYSSISAGNASACAIAANRSLYCWGSNDNGQLGNGSIVDSDTPVAVVSLNFSSVSVGDFSTCGVEISGAAYCWGADGSGQLGNGLPLANVLTPSLVSDPSGGAVSYSSLSVGFGYACGMSTSGSAFCWGGNATGQLGDNSTAASDIPTRDAASSLTL